MGIEPVPLVSIELKVTVSDSSKHRAERDKSSSNVSNMSIHSWWLPDDA